LLDVWRRRDSLIVAFRLDVLEMLGMEGGYEQVWYCESIL
jgi:hypothetical protein